MFIPTHSRLTAPRPARLSPGLLALVLALLLSLVSARHAPAQPLQQSQQSGPTVAADSLRAALRTPAPDSARAKTALRLSAALTATDTAGAGQAARLALALSRRAGFGYGQAHGWLQLGSLAIISHDNVRAAACGQRAQALADSLYRRQPSPRLRRLLAAIANNRGNVAERQGQYEAASRFYLRAAALLPGSSPTPPMLLTVYGNLGTCFQALGQPGEAARYWRLAVALRPRPAAPGPVELLPTYLQLAGRHLVRQEPDSAWQQLRAAQALLPANTLFTSAYYSKLSDYYILVRQPDAARTALEQALAAATRQGAATDQARLLFSLSQLDVSLGRPAPARAALRRSLALSERLADPQQRMASLEALAQLEERAGQWQVALIYYRRGHDLRDSLAGEAVRQQVSALETQYRTREQARELARLRREQAAQQQALRQARRLNTVYLALAVALAGIGALALGLLRNRRRLARQQQELQARRLQQLEQDRALQVARAVVEGQEDERGRVARDLHDGVGGMLATVKLYLGSARSRLAPPPAAPAAATLPGSRRPPPDEPTELLQEAIVHLDSSIGELRRVARNLLPEAVVAFGLAQALHDLCATVQQSSSLQVRLQLHGLETRLDPATEVSLYRITQELLTNAVRHAHASQVLVQLMRHADSLQLVVEDDGRGFEPAATAGGVGLRSLRARAAYLGAALDVQSAPDQGTTVSLELRLG